MIDLLSPADILAAATCIAPHVLRTPTLNSPALDRAIGARTFIKAEPLQRTGSFKLRGAFNALLQLSADERARGVVTYSSGNHGQAIACAAAALGIAATIVMPADAPAIKRDSTAGWSAEIIAYDRMREDREAIGQAIKTETGAVLIPPYEHPHIIAGQGSVALELIQDAGEPLDLILVCTGGGGLTAGCALAIEAASPATRLIAVEPEGWDDTGRSLRAGQRVKNDGTGSRFCDALLAPTPGALTFAINQSRLAGAVSVNDAEVLAAMRFALIHLKLAVEPGGAVALAAALADKLPPELKHAGQSIGIVLSGGNADPESLIRALA